MKFGVEWAQVADAFAAGDRCGVRVSGIMAHIGSLFLEPDVFHLTVLKLLALAEQFPQVPIVLVELRIATRLKSRNSLLAE